jgi:predicted metal-dependent hydrolase
MQQGNRCGAGRSAKYWLARWKITLLTALFKGVRSPQQASEPVIITVETAAGPAHVQIMRHARATRLRLTQKRDGSGFRLTLPMRYPLKRAQAWLAEQADWMARQLAGGQSDRILVAPGMQVPFRGRMLQIEWDTSLPRQPQIAGDMICLGGPQDNVGRRLARFFKAQALEMLDAETRAVAAEGGLRVAAVSVADPKSRWGSCAHDGQIRYSWRLIMMPDAVRRATVAHEVAHLRHMHHGPDFHTLVDQLYGQSVAKERRWLKREGTSVHRYDFGT